MDTLTHALSGALLARATEPGVNRDAVPRRTRMATCFWAAAFPDSDIVLRFIDPLTYLSAHRGVTHSIVMLPLWALGLALLFQLLYRNRYSWRTFIGVCLMGIAIHIAGDVITSFGTMIFAPLSRWRAQLSTTFIIDLNFTSIIVGALLASLYWKRTRLPAVIGMGLLVGYIGMQAILKQQASEIGQAYIATHKLKQAQSHALPQPFSPFNWMVIVEQPDVYHLSVISLTRETVHVSPPGSGLLRRVFDSYRPVDKARWESIPRYGNTAREAELAKAAWESPAIARYRHFAMFPAAYRFDQNPAGTCVRFHDLRFALLGRVPPFRYATCLDHVSNSWKLYEIKEHEGAESLYPAD